MSKSLVDFDFLNAKTKDLKEFMELNYPDVSLKGLGNRNSLISLCASKLKSDVELRSYGVLDVCPYFVMPIFVDYQSDFIVSKDDDSGDDDSGDGSNSNDKSKEILEKERTRRCSEFKKKIEETMRYFKSLEYKVIRNKKNITPEEEEKVEGPKRWQSLPLYISPSKVKNLPKLLHEVIGSIASLGRKLNPMFELSDVRILKSDPGLVAQFVHGDNTSYWDARTGKEKTNAMVVSGLVAFEEKTVLDISYGKQLTHVEVNVGQTIVFKASQAHRGSANQSNKEHYRLHYTLKKPATELIDNNLVFLHRCKFCDGYHRASSLDSHRRSCSANPNSANRRKYLCQNARKMREKEKANKKQKSF